MAKKGGGRLQRKEAVEIAKKLGAEVIQGAKHQLAAVRFKGVLVTSFGIRHSRKVGHGHLPKMLFLSERETLDLARCQITSEQYFEILHGKGKLEPPA